VCVFVCAREADFFIKRGAMTSVAYMYASMRTFVFMFMCLCMCVCVYVWLIAQLLHQRLRRHVDDLMYEYDPV
jgi:hypothetical protein